MLLEVISPYRGEKVAELPFDEGEMLERKIEAARRAFAMWRRVPLAERIRRVHGGLEYFRTSSEEIAIDIARQMGKPLRQARMEIGTLLQRAEHMLSIAADALAPDLLPCEKGFHRRIEHEPLGVVFNLAAWNYPLLIPVNVVVPALLAGNVVLLKHSARTPLVGRHFERAFGELGVEGTLIHVVLSHAETARIIQDPRIAHVAFTGSVEGGRAVHAAAANRFIDVGLELGGKDPAYVAADADLDFSAANVVDGACYNAGQSCCAVERVYVHRDVYEEFLERVRPELEVYSLGDPLAETTTMGPLVSSSAVELLELQVEDAVRRGARLLLGGHHVGALPGHFFAPTLLADVPQDADVMREESFGPIVPVQAVASDDEALERMNDSRYGLTASIWTRDRDRAERFAANLEAGTVFQNRCDYLDPALPWTGHKDSGRGSTLSRYSFWHLTRRKSVHFRGA